MSILPYIFSIPITICSTFRSSHMLYFQKALLYKIYRILFQTKKMLVNHIVFYVSTNILSFHHLGIYIKEIQKNPFAILEELNFEYTEQNPDFEWNYKVLSDVLSHFDGRYPRLLEQLDQAKKIYEESDVLSTYNKFLERFESNFPNHEIMFEKMLINDLFFKQFPFQKNFKLWDQYLSICGTYVLLRYLAINLSYSKDTLEDLIDILSKTFTVTGHSEFDKELSGYFNDNSLNNLDILAKIILI